MMLTIREHYRLKASLNLTIIYGLINAEMRGKCPPVEGNMVIRVLHNHRLRALSTFSKMRDLGVGVLTCESLFRVEARLLPSEATL